MTAIHRLLDEAFVGIDVTADVQDLKEEMRANLAVRVAELEAAGAPEDDAARRAMAELGDIRSIVDELDTSTVSSPPWQRNKVRPKPGFVMRTVVLGVVAAALVATEVLTHRSAATLGWMGIASGVLALVAGIIVADALRQETTTNYPVPPPRALGYAAATAVGVAGLGIGVLYLRQQRMSFVVAGGLAVLLSVVWFTYLGVTQTNRHKPWVVRMAAAAHETDRFVQDPAAAARFGVYTVTIWIVALTAFGVLSFTVGWAWSWLALVGGVVAMMLTLARMLFVPSTVDSAK
jgi:hypothetical protein